MKIFFDGGCRPNPGPMHTAVVAGGRVYLHDNSGSGDNNDAEWLALIRAAEIARSLKVDDAVLLGDSALVVNQANGRAACRAPRFAERLAQFHALSAGAHLRVRRVRRSQNLAGIALERFHGRL